jgi:hypothetical protein
MASRQLILIFLRSTIVFISAFTFVQFFQLGQTSKGQEEPIMILLQNPLLFQQGGTTRQLIGLQLSN